MVVSVLGLALAGLLPGCGGGGGGGGADAGATSDLGGGGDTAPGADVTPPEDAPEPPDDVPAPDGAEGATRCAGTVVQTCTDGAWADGDDSADDDEAPGDDIIAACTDCHTDDAFVNHNHTAKGATRVICHMPRIVESATSEEQGGLTCGDIRGLIFALDPSAEATLSYTDDAGSWASGAVPAVYACFQCHTDRDAAWVEENAHDVHDHEHE